MRRHVALMLLSLAACGPASSDEPADGTWSATLARTATCGPAPSAPSAQATLVVERASSSGAFSMHLDMPGAGRCTLHALTSDYGVATVESAAPGCAGGVAPAAATLGLGEYGWSAKSMSLEWRTDKADSRGEACVVRDEYRLARH